MDIGFKCNTRPSRETEIALELVPKEKILSTLVCPSCGHTHKYSEGDNAPESCGACDIVFSKYSQNLKREREKIKSALVAKAEYEEKAQQQEKQRLLEEERRKLLEEEIRKELGLPRFVARRSALISSATGIFALGLVLGVGGVLAYDSLRNSHEHSYDLSQQQADSGVVVQTNTGMEQMYPGPLTNQTTTATETMPKTQLLPDLPPETVAKMDPVMVSHMQVSDMLNTQSEMMEYSSTVASPGTQNNQMAMNDEREIQAFSSNVDNFNGLSSSVSQNITTTINGLPSTSNENSSAGFHMEFSASELVHEMYVNLKIDPEWEDFVTRQAYEMVAKGRNSAAQATLKLINDPLRQTEETAKLAVWLAHNGQSEESDRTFQQLMQDLEVSPLDNRTMVASYHLIVRSQATIPGKPLDAEATAMKARVIAESMTGPCDQAVISAEVAGMMSNIGHHKAAREAYRRSNEGLSRIESRQELLSCLGELVESHLRAGNRNGAVILLQDMSRGGKVIESQAEHDVILQRISYLYRELGDMQTAQQLTREIMDPQLRYPTQYRNVINEINAGRIGAAMQGMEAIESTSYKARAFAMLGLSQGRSKTYISLADESFRQAKTLITTIANPVEKSVVSAELARYVSHAGRDGEADAGFADAVRLLDSTTEATDRNQPMAILAANQARALRLAEAHRQLLNVNDVTIAQVTNQILSDSELLIRERTLGDR